MRQTAACIFCAVFVAFVLVIGVGTAAAVVPTWDPAPVEEEAQERREVVEDEEVAEREEASESPYPAFYSRGADFNRLGAAEFSMLPALELGATQAIHGMVLGWLFCEGILDCRGDQFLAAGLAGLALGAGGGILANLYLQPAPGQVAATNTGSYVGITLGFLAAELASSRESGTFMFFGGLGGTALGALVSTQLRWTAGDVALVNLGALLAATTLLVVEEFAWRTRLYDVLLDNEWRAIGFVAASMVAGGVVAWRYPMDRFRVRLIGAGAFAGGLVTGFVFGMATMSDPGAMAGFGLGMLGGAAAMGYLSRDLDAHFRADRGERLTTVVPSVAPRLDGQGVTLSLSGRF